MSDASSSGAALHDKPTSITPATSILLRTFGHPASELTNSAGYLQESVFPVLLPALEKMLVHVKHLEDQGQSTDDFDPINWLAQVLFYCAFG
jgi:hypothetical protein